VRSARDVGLAAEDRLDATFHRQIQERDGPEHVAVVGHRHRRHPEADRLVDQLLETLRAVEQRVLRVIVQVDEGRFRHRHSHSIVAGGLLLMS
jgi:hypothetical protein